ncbi:MAG: PIF1 family DEAD/DEAH box helicase [Bacteroidales bacterium]|nr:PIF1 family DEAD/DEAH box helicase [Bacteroidales bacterium]
MEIVKDKNFLLAERYVYETGLSVYLTGKAGTGKTTFLRSIVENCPKRCAVVAPTGVAAINAGGVTIHSFFQLPLCPYLPDVKELVTEYQLPEKESHYKKSQINLFRSLDLLIIDEISMVRADILDAIDFRLRTFRRNQKPFGGVQLLMIGDIQQLPPVVKDSEKQYYDKVYPSPFFFFSKALQNTPYITLQLETVFRQRSQTFVDILNDVRSGTPSDGTLAMLNSRFNPSFEPPKKESWIRLTTHNALADSVNASKMNALKGKQKAFEAKIECEFPESMYPADTRIEMKVGAQVMFLRNNSMQGYYNGKIGTVTSLTPDIIVTDEEGKEYEVQPEIWENIKYKISESTGEIEMHREGVFQQIPLRYAWAITIHKSQGLTFDKVIIDAGSAFSFGQIYVALSRCRSLEGIVLSSKISRSGFFRDDNVLGFESTYTSFESAEDTFSAHKRQQYVDRVCDAFNLDELRYLYNRINRIYNTELPSKFRSNALQYSALSDPSLEVASDKPYAGLKELKDVAARFRSQLQRMVYSIPEEDECPTDEIKQRIAKGAVYFSDQLTFLAQKVIPLMTIEISNKEQKKSFNTAGVNFLIELRFRIELYSQILLKGFSAEEYLKSRTKLEVNAESTIKNCVKPLKKIVDPSH